MNPGEIDPKEFLLSLGDILLEIDEKGVVYNFKKNERYSGTNILLGKNQHIDEVFSHETVAKIRDAISSGSNRNLSSKIGIVSFRQSPETIFEARGLTGKEKTFLILLRDMNQAILETGWLQDSKRKNKKLLDGIFGTISRDLWHNVSR